jgi:hypothetical protein
MGDGNGYPCAEAPDVGARRFRCQAREALGDAVVDDAVSRGMAVGPTSPTRTNGRSMTASEAATIARVAMSHALAPISGAAKLMACQLSAVDSDEPARTFLVSFANMDV